LSGTVVLQDNGTDDKSVTASGGFTFATPLASGMTYAVTVHTQPASQYCTPTSASGTVTNNPITSVAVTCDSGIKCGSNECNPATGYTCCDPEGSHTSCTKSFCQQLDLPCDSAADCAARGTPGICCASTYRGAVDSVSCSSSCSGGSRTILCDPNLPGACASGTCTAYSALPGYYACQ
ncbi:MAG TPA: hypothetical protein VLX92_12865, partial [Kofleriaceae bacterium]|nr:hypothetical protein [Kofleriaceae bacterium]